jgi:hypothetical protein
MAAVERRRRCTSGKVTRDVSIQASLLLDGIAITLAVTLVAF